MNKTEIVHKIHKDLGKEVTLKNIDLVVDKFLDVMIEAIGKGEEVQLGEFGSFSLTKFAVKPAEKFVKDFKLK